MGIYVKTVYAHGQAAEKGTLKEGKGNFERCTMCDRAHHSWFISWPNCRPVTNARLVQVIYGILCNSQHFTHQTWRIHIIPFHDIYIHIFVTPICSVVFFLRIIFFFNRFFFSCCCCSHRWWDSCSKWQIIARNETCWRYKCIQIDQIWRCRDTNWTSLAKSSQNRIWRYCTSYSYSDIESRAHENRIKTMHLDELALVKKSDDLFLRSDLNCCGVNKLAFSIVIRNLITIIQFYRIKYQLNYKSFYYNAKPRIPGNFHIIYSKMSDEKKNYTRTLLHKFLTHLSTLKTIQQQQP